MTKPTPILRGIVLLSLLAAVLSACSEDTPVGFDGTGPLKGRSCFEFDWYLHTLSLTDTPGVTNAAVADGGFAYLADGNNGFQVVDARDPGAPVLRGAVAGGDAAIDVALADSVVCVTFGPAGMALVRHGDPDRPIIVGRVDTPGGARGVAVEGTVAYVADDVMGLMLFDIGDPSAPAPLGVDNTPGRAVDVAVSGVFAYVADLSTGLRVVNVANPATPWLASTVPMPGPASGVAVDGDYVYVACWDAGLRVVDVSTPGSETIVGSLDTPGLAEGVVVSGRYAFVADSHAGVRVIDVGDPENPVEVNHAAASGPSNEVFLVGGLLYVSESYGGLRIISAANPLPVPVLARMQLPLGETVNHLSAEVATGTVYGAGEGAGLFGVQLGDSEFLRRGSRLLPADPLGLVVWNGLAFVALDPTGAVIYKVGDPRFFSSAGTIPYPGEILDMAVADSVVYFATGASVFGIFQLGEDETAGLGLTGGRTSAVAINGTCAYVASENRQMHLVDVTDPSQPYNLGVHLIAGAARRALVDGSLFFLVVSNEFTNGLNGVAIYDVELPMYPIAIGFAPLTARPVDAAVSGTTLYVALGTSGVEVFDVSDPAAPVRTGYIAAGNDATGVTVTAGAVFVANNESGLVATRAQGCVPDP